ncbi:unnamed protein product [Schistosoma margrebowiei]|uniref:Uncharacterized protein n=1 Tax=Schistosoma margrebowiei TaxID=48269 RepID=A0A183MD94_9TREM|nr:unnamed protein product [Schistosoma margrebowiei]
MCHHSASNHMLKNCLNFSINDFNKLKNETKMKLYSLLIQLFPSQLNHKHRILKDFHMLSH